ncbi:hypothetical protein CBP36_00815 [Acidovorax carolinensis]|uniref:Glycine zipper 2TM domain-containing protein n=1 Tax=Acidovorax carolinensis TaxID=553814 RepID=A0A240U901_9BURK|nr:glycine zipper 2TM domain-containing protein [Acidovorax carolinensis]ART56446.1 hypothetical protein CBP35_18140 [Acidovorax carolinensis]ART57596.1 hypothetical protein CBP36_00815 [Acidovorax carolinensis]
MQTNPSTATNAPMAATPAGVPLKWLWAAIAALGLCVLALGATLVAQQRPGAVAEREALASPAPRTPESEIIDEKRPVTLSQRAQTAPEYGANPSSAAAPVQRAAARAYPQAPQPARYDESAGRQDARQEMARAPVCAVCGRIESVQAVQHAAPATGVGAVAGGVLGGVVGNQIGKGSGRTAATVLGAVGGGYVGHTVEQRTRTETAYEVRVRMDDGSVRRFTRSQPVPEGAPVRVDGKGFQLV